MHRPFRSLSLAITLVAGAGLLVLPDPALADPPDWAKANGHRAQHTADGKRHGRDGDHGDYDVTPQSLIGGGVCIPRPSGAQARAVLGQGLASQVTGGNATSAALGGVLGAVLGSQFGGGASAADEDCTSRVRPIGSGSRGKTPPPQPATS